MTPSDFQVLKQICDTIQGRVSEVLESQKKVEALVHQHETRITILEHEQNLCPYLPRIDALEGSTRESSHSSTDHEVRIKTLEEIARGTAGKWSKWEGRIIAFLQAVLIVLMGAYLSKGGGP